MIKCTLCDVSCHDSKDLYLHRGSNIHETLVALKNLEEAKENLKIVLQLEFLKLLISGIKELKNAVRFFVPKLPTITAFLLAFFILLSILK